MYWADSRDSDERETYAGDIVGLQLSAANNPRTGSGVAADRREISFGLLGRHAVSITYGSGSDTHTQPVLGGLGAYLIVHIHILKRPGWPIENRGELAVLYFLVFIYMMVRGGGKYSLDRVLRGKTT